MMNQQKYHELWILDFLHGKNRVFFSKFFFRLSQMFREQNIWSETKDGNIPNWVPKIDSNICFPLRQQQFIQCQKWWTKIRFVSHFFYTCSLEFHAICAHEKCSLANDEFNFILLQFSCDDRSKKLTDNNDFGIFSSFFTIKARKIQFQFTFFDFEFQWKSTNMYYEINIFFWWEPWRRRSERSDLTHKTCECIAGADGRRMIKWNNEKSFSPNMKANLYKWFRKCLVRFKDERNM